MKRTVETQAFKFPGLLVLGALLALQCAGIALLVSGGAAEVAPKLAGGAVLLASALCFSGFTLLQPNEARVITLLGRYAGTISDAGFFWALPLTVKKPVSLRIANFISEKLKVNDALGNPIEIASVIVWRVEHPAQAALDVMDYAGFVRIQTETALRKIAAQFAYDTHGEPGPSLRGSPSEVCRSLRDELQSHLTAAGIVVVDAQISHLAYAPEIAQAMLRRQQAQAIIAARRQIVDGAVGMVEMALKQLGDKHVVELDEERKAQMVSNLLVTLVAESNIQPVLNTGSIY
jgi:regulator of protease activity HflC (stomatin/prohibitin superfamily)